MSFHKGFHAANLLSFSSKMSMGRRRTVRVPQTPMLTPCFFIAPTKAAESFVSKEMYPLRNGLATEPLSPNR